MVLTRALVRWFRQSQQPTLVSSEPSSDAASDSHDSRHHTQSSAFSSSSFTGILLSLLQSQYGSRSTVPDQTATSPSSHFPLNDLVTRPAVSPSAFTPAQLASLFSHLPLMPPSRHAVRDAGHAAAVVSPDESVYDSDQSVNSSRLEARAAHLQMLRAERRPAGLNAVLRPHPTFVSLSRSVCISV